jgi:transposase
MYLNVGIDVAKNIHEVCMVNENGEQIGKYFQLRNSKKSMQKFKMKIESISKELNAKPRIGLEATGIYWYSLHSELSKYYKVHIFNPSQSSGFSSVNIRDSKTDKIDALTIANMLRFGESPKTNYGDKQRLELREYGRFYFKLTSIKTNLKKRMGRNLHLIFPGYDQIFKNLYTETSKEILKTILTPEKVLETGEEKLFEIMKEKSRNHISPDKAKALIEKAEDTIPSEIIKESSIFEFQMLFEVIEYLENRIAAIEEKILFMWSKVREKHYIQTIIGVSELRAAMIWAEMGEVDDFKNPDQIIAFAGLDPKVKQSGNKEIIRGPSKRGPKILRWVLGWVVQEAKNSNCVLGDYFDRKINEGKHYNTARCATAKKLIRIIWFVEKNKKPFQIPNNFQSS